MYRKEKLQGMRGLKELISMCEWGLLMEKSHIRDLHLIHIR